MKVVTFKSDLIESDSRMVKGFILFFLIFLLHTLKSPQMVFYSEVKLNVAKEFRKHEKSE